MPCSSHLTKYSNNKFPILSLEDKECASQYSFTQVKSPTSAGGKKLHGTNRLTWSLTEVSQQAILCSIIELVTLRIAVRAMCRAGHCDTCRARRAKTSTPLVGRPSHCRGWPQTRPYPLTLSVFLHYCDTPVMLISFDPFLSKCAALPFLPLFIPTPQHILEPQLRPPPSLFLATFWAFFFPHWVFFYHFGVQAWC